MTRPYSGGPLPPPPDLPARPRRILLVRLSARGDVLFALPFAELVRRRWPEARIDWVVEAPAADMVVGHPEIDEVVVWDRAAFKRLGRAGRLIALSKRLLGLRRRLLEGEYDLVIDLQGMSRSALLARATGAPTRIGLGAREGSAPLYTHTFPAHTDIDRIGGDYRDLAAWMGLDAGAWRLHAPLAAEARSGAATRLEAAGITDDYIAVVPHTTRPQKHWDEARWGPLLDALHERTGHPVVVLGGPDDRAATERITAAANAATVVDLVGRTTLGEAAAIVAGAHLVVGVDTGLTHVAHYHDRRTVCLFGPAAYVVPPTPMARIIRHDELECVRCMPRGGSPTCDGAWWCMDRITPSEIMGHVDDLLEGRPDPRPAARS